MAWMSGTARVPDGGLTRGPAALFGRGRITNQRAGPAGLPPGTGSIHACLGARCQVTRLRGGRAAARGPGADLTGGDQVSVHRQRFPPAGPHRVRPARPAIADAIGAGSRSRGPRRRAAAGTTPQKEADHDSGK